MKTFTINNTEYTVTPCTAIASCDLNTGDRQDALLIENTADSGEKFRYVVFGYEMPTTAEDFQDMADDSSAWESDCEVLETVATIWYAVMTDSEDTDWGTGSYDLDEAREKVSSLKAQGYPEAYIAVINEGDDPICVDEIREED